MPKRPISEFVRVANQIGELLDRKNAAYGSSFASSGEALKLLYPNGVPPEHYSRVLLLVRVWDKMKRIATDNDPTGETPWRDLAGYGILGTVLHEQTHEEETDAAPVPAVGMSQGGEEQTESVLFRDVPARAEARGAEGDGEPLRIEEVPDVPAQPQWSQTWSAEKKDAVTEESIEEIERLASLINDIYPNAGLAANREGFVVIADVRSIIQEWLSIRPYATPIEAWRCAARSVDKDVSRG